MDLQTFYNKFKPNVFSENICNNKSICRSSNPSLVQRVSASAFFSTYFVGTPVSDVNVDSKA